VRTPNDYNIDVLALRVEAEAVLLPVKVVAGASQTSVLGEWNGRVRIAVAAAPQRGKANAELLAFLAKRLRVRKCDVAIVAGEASPLKTIRIDQTTADAVRAALQCGRS